MEQSLQASVGKGTNLAVLFAAAVGLAFACLVLPQRALDPWSTGWLKGDLWQVYQAWAIYLSDGRWPLLVTNRVSYPLDLSISLFDPMPLLLWLAGAMPIRWTDQPFQLIGPYFVICLLLQGGFGALLTRDIVRAVNPQVTRLALLSFIGGVLIVALPFTAWRFHNHTALSSQWVVVLAAWVAVRFRAAGFTPWAIPSLGVTLLATGINPYLMVMCCMVPACIAIVGAIAREVPVVEALLRIVSVALVAVSGLGVFGFLSGVYGGVDSGYGLYSMNLLGFVDSNDLAGIWRLDIPDATGGQQAEGFTFLGAGLLGLTALAVWGAWGRRGELRRNWPMGAILLAMLIAFFLAISNKITLGANEIALVPWPPGVPELLSKFRSSARFFWVAGILLVPVVLAILSGRLSRRSLSAVLVGALLIQVVDVVPVAWNIRGWINEGERYRAPEFAVPKGVTMATVIPPWQCDVTSTPGTDRGFELVGDYMLRFGLKTNSFYAARTPIAHRDHTCDPANWIGSAGGDTSSLYLISGKPDFEGFATRLAATHACARRDEYDGYILCLPAT